MPNDMLKDIHARIVRRLEAVGLSESKAAKIAGLSDTAIRNIRRKVERDPDTEEGVLTSTLKRLAPVLGTTVSWLAEETGPETRAENLVEKFELLPREEQIEIRREIERRLGQHTGRENN